MAGALLGSEVKKTDEIQAQRGESRAKLMEGSVNHSYGNAAVWTVRDIHGWIST